MKNVTSIITVVGIFLTYYIFRSSLVQRRSNYLKSVEDLLKCVSYWFKNSYDDNSYNVNWKNPGFIVYKVNANIIDQIIIDSSVIFDGYFIERLVQFSQLVTKFNQFVDDHPL